MGPMEAENLSLQLQITVLAKGGRAGAEESNGDKFGELNAEKIRDSNENSLSLRECQGRSFHENSNS